LTSPNATPRAGTSTSASHVIGNCAGEAENQNHEDKQGDADIEPVVLDGEANGAERHGIWIAVSLCEACT